MNSGIAASHKEDISRIVSLLKKSEGILFITGAGISADSGLPTYRGIGGLYNQGTTDEGIPIEMALAGEMLRQRPEVTWRYISQIEKNCRGARFNRAHAVIAEMEKYFPRVWVFTQNIDGLHRQAGSRNIIDIHGDMHKLFCPACGWKREVRDYDGLRIPPRCPEGHIVRPQVVFFGEQLPEEQLMVLMREMERGFDLYFSIGTTSTFAYVQQPIWHARNCAKPTIEINPSDTEVTDLVDIKLPLRAAEALDIIWKEFRGEAL